MIATNDREELAAAAVWVAQNRRRLFVGGGTSIAACTDELRDALGIPFERAEELLGHGFAVADAVRREFEDQKRGAGKDARRTLAAGMRRIRAREVDGPEPETDR